MLLRLKRQQNLKRANNVAVKESVRRRDDDELVGFVVNDTSGWQAQTVFGYPIQRSVTKADAEQVVREKGLNYLMGVWSYKDSDDNDWHACILAEVYEHKVVVRRTNEMGYEDPGDVKRVELKNPNEETLVKIS